MRRFFALALLASGGVALADRAAGDRLAAEAEALAGRGDLLGAAAKFRAAYAVDPRPELICNVGVAYYKVLELPRAHRYLAQCKELSAQLDRAFVANVDQVIAAVEQRLEQGDFTPVQLVVEPAAAATTIAGGPFDEPFVGPRTAWLPFGHYTLVVHAEGYVDQRIELDARTRTPVTETVRLERVQAPPPPPPRLPPPPPPPPQQSVPEHHYTAAIATTSVTGVAAIVAIATYVTARDHASKANDLAAGDVKPLYDAEASAARDWQHGAWVAAGIAGAGAAISGYLWYRATREPMVEVQATPGGAAVSLTGAW